VANKSLICGLKPKYTCIILTKKNQRTELDIVEGIRTACVLHKQTVGVLVKLLLHYSNLIILPNFRFSINKLMFYTQASLTNINTIFNTLSFKHKIYIILKIDVIKKNEILTFAGKWMELENTILSKVSQV
jgi:hypothetical protein